MKKGKRIPEFFKLIQKNADALRNVLWAQGVKRTLIALKSELKLFLGDEDGERDMRGM